MNLIPSLSITGDALNSQRVRMDIVAQNIANAQTTRDVDGKAYQRKIVSFEAVMDKANGSDNATAGVKTVRVSGITADPSPGDRIFNPSHPDADKDGMVEMPNIKMAQEMVDLISSSRSYEANLAVARNSKTMAEAALRIGR